MAKFSSTRAAFVMICIGIALISLIGRVAYLETYGRQQTILRAERQQHQSEVLPARRGEIFDANGTLMAGTVQREGIFVDAKFMQESFDEDGKTLVETDDLITKLAHLLDQDPLKLIKLLSDRSNDRFIKIAENVDENTCQAIAKLNIPGVGLTPISQRCYPMGSLAAHIMGDVGKEGKGLEGLELKYEEILGGKPGFKRTLKDARRRGIAVSTEDYLPPVHGQHLILTIDANIQMIAEQELAGVCEKVRAKRGEVVVMDPRTGDIVAMANWPTFNPQNLEDSEKEIRRNNCLSSPFEPGSAIKPFIVGPALAMGVVRPEQVWPIHAITWTTSYGRHITDVHGYGPLCTWDVLVKSSNIGMCMIGEKFGNSNLYKSLHTFGFGQVTGVEMPGEDRGMLNPLKTWSHFSTDSVSQGYELMVTPLQLARSFCAYANGGRLVQPRVIKGVLNPDGTVASLKPAPALKDLPVVVDPEAAATIRRILCDVVVRGTAKPARSQIWNIFGKTGTAHISEGKAGYSGSKFNSTFLGGAPAENPRLVVAFVVHEPDRSIAHYGGTVSAPGAGKLLERALAYLRVPESPELPQPAPAVARYLVNFTPNLYRKTPPTASVNSGD